MGYDTQRAKLESELARAHRALYYAEEAAEALSDFGMQEDLKMLLKEVTRLGEASLRGKARRSQLAGQFEISA